MITVKLDLRNKDNYSKSIKLATEQYNIIAIEDKYILVMRKL